MPETKITKSLVVKGNIAAVYVTILTKLTSLNFEKFSSTWPTEIQFSRGKNTFLANNLLDVKTVLNVYLEQIQDDVHVKFDYTLEVPSTFVKKDDTEIEREFTDIKNSLLKELSQNVILKQSSTLQKPLETESLISRKKDSEEKSEFLLRIVETMRENIVELDRFFKKLKDEHVLLLNKVYSDEFNDIKKDVNDLLRVTSHLLDVEKIDSNDFTFIKNNHSLSEIVLTKIVTLKKEAESRHTTITQEIQPRIMCYCDKNRIEQVVENLILNAIEFSPKENGHIHVLLQRIDDIVKLVVKDNGLGIKKENIDLIFYRLYRIDPALNLTYNADGLGMSICKWIVENHGGSIWVESEGVGKGAEIHISLPLVTQAVGTLKKVE
ncbi:MAG: HAMP domain-containing sensor histidine kinase [Thermoproteota archaeon]|mgnify:FL=1